MIGHTAGLTWADIEWMKHECGKHGMALMIKGVMTAEDTARACLVCDRLHGARRAGVPMNANECQ